MLNRYQTNYPEINPIRNNMKTQSIGIEMVYRNGDQ